MSWLDRTSSLSRHCLFMRLTIQGNLCQGRLMKKFIGLILILCLTGCAICKSTDTPEQCRTKQRDHSQRNSAFADQPPIGR
jgi:hypothetical protein